MSSSVNISNKLVMNKYVWIGRQLRNFNDVGSSINWANAMNLVKGLLLETQPERKAYTNPHPPSTSFLPSHHRFSTHQRNIFQTKIPRSTHSTRSITPPTTVCFKPAPKENLTQSPPRGSSYIPSKPSPLTTYTLDVPYLFPTDSFPQCPKRRKLTIPPSVDHHASIESPKPASPAITDSEAKIIPEQGKHIWYLHDPKKPDHHRWTKKLYKSAKEYKVVKVPPDFNTPFKLMDVATGEYLTMMFNKEDVKFLFET